MTTLLTNQTFIAGVPALKLRQFLLEMEDATDLATFERAFSAQTKTPRSSSPV